MGIGIYDFKSKRKLPSTFKQNDVYVQTHKNQYCVIRKKNRKYSSLDGEEEIKKNFKFV